MRNYEFYGFSAYNSWQTDDFIPARIVSVHRDRFRAVCTRGETWAILKTTEYYVENETFPTAGDYVLLEYNEYGESRIVKTLPRKSYFSRKDPDRGRGEQLVAANFDYVFIVQSLNHDFNVKRLERYLTIAWQSGGEPIVLLTKTDLVDNVNEYIDLAKRYSMGAEVLAVSALTGEGLNELSKYNSVGKTSVFLGSSGLGKSSHVNALRGEAIMDVSSIREDDSKGRHTTTHRQLIMLYNGSMIIDTPGMRELGMWDVSEGLPEAFSDVEKFLGNCKYRNCTHTCEPGCAILTAIETGELSLDRWNSYNSLKSEALFTDDKESYLRQKKEWHKSLSKGSKIMKQNGKIRR
jgi:ribosome biogenesis GTPase